MLECRGCVQESEQMEYNQRIVCKMLSRQQITGQEVTAAPLFPVKAMKVLSPSQNAQPARFSFQHPLLQTFDVLLTLVSPSPLHPFIVHVLSAGNNLSPVMSQILILPMYLFLLWSQQCNLLLSWYFHGSQCIKWQSSNSIASDHQRPSLSHQLLHTAVICFLSVLFQHWQNICCTGMNQDRPFKFLLQNCEEKYH